MMIVLIWFLFILINNLLVCFLSSTIETVLFILFIVPVLWVIVLLTFLPSLCLSEVLCSLMMRLLPLAHLFFVGLLLLLIIMAKRVRMMNELLSLLIVITLLIGSFWLRWRLSCEWMLVAARYKNRVSIIRIRTRLVETILTFLMVVSSTRTN